MAKEDRGFASMDRSKQREIASKGGKAAHQKGTAHEWTSDEAREAGRKGGMASHRRKQERAADAPVRDSLEDDNTGEPMTSSATPTASRCTNRRDAQCRSGACRDAFGTAIIGSS